MADLLPESALADIARHLKARGRKFALVGGLAVSLRAEVRFTRDVDLAIAALEDNDVERLVYDLQAAGYVPIAIVEQEALGRIATVRLESPSGIVVDLLVASAGIEAEVIDRATPLTFDEAGEIPVARAEELLAMKILSMTGRRPQDRMDATNLLLCNEQLDLEAVRDNLDRITERGFHRDEDLRAKLELLLSELREQSLPRGA